MHDAGPARSADPGELGKSSEEPMGERGGRATRSGVHDESRRLVENDQLVVDMEQAELSLLGFETVVAPRRRLPDDPLSGSQQGARLGGEAAVDEDAAGVDPLPDLIAGRRARGGEGGIEALTGGLFRNGPGACRQRWGRRESMTSRVRPTQIALSATLKSGQR
ncbi:MAG: hypothetical protein R2862_06940 [Thermoanaerobaculia bacterium]